MIREGGDWDVGDRVGWVGNNWGVILAGPWRSLDERLFWWVAMEGSKVPTTVDDQWLRRDTRDDVKDGAS